MNDTQESVRRVLDGLAAAVDRGRRARAEANAEAQRFRTHTKEVAASDSAVMDAAKSQSQTPSDGSDLDFSQAQIMY